MNTRVVDGGVITSTDEDHPNGSAKYQLPLDTTLGARFHPLDQWDIYTDISFQLGTTYSKIPNSTLNSEVKTDPTFRYNLGTEFKPAEHFPIRLGFFYNPSALHDFSNNGQSQNKSDFMGYTAGFSYHTEHVESGLGFFYISGSGKSTTNGAPGNDSNYAASGTGAVLTSAYYF